MSRLHNYKPLILLFFFSFCLQADRLPGSFRLRLSKQMIKVHPVMQLPPAQFRQPRLPAIPSPRFCRLPKTGVSAFRRKAKFLSVMHLSMSFSNITPTMHKRRIKKSSISLLTAAMKTATPRRSLTRSRSIRHPQRSLSSAIFSPTSRILSNAWRQKAISSETTPGRTRICPKSPRRKPSPKN